MVNASDSAAVQDNINAYWNFRSGSYDDSAGHGIRSDEELQAWLTDLRAVLPEDCRDVLDVGTGTGFLALLYQQLGHRVTGVDLSEGMLNVARDKAAELAEAPTFLVGDAVAPPFEGEQFDAIVSRHVMWTLRDPVVAFENWRKLLRPGGRVVAIDGLWWDEEDGGQKTTDLNDEESRLWNELYSDSTIASLPIMTATNIEPIARLLEQAGFVDISVQAMPTVQKLREGTTNKPHYVLMGVRS